MNHDDARVIRIAAGLIEDGAGRLLLVRKKGTGWFMQAGGKIEEGESPSNALRRELAEEIGLVLAEEDARPLACRVALAANEPGHFIEAEIFHVRTRHEPAAGAEIEEAVWVDHALAMQLPLAPLTRDHVLPLFRALRSAQPGLRPPPDDL